MTDTVVEPSGSEAWSVSTLPDYESIGRINQSGAIYSIDPVQSGILVGINVGPFPSKDAAMEAIASHTKGICRMMNLKQ